MVLLLLLVLALGSGSGSGALGSGRTTREVSRDDFPPGFVFGAGTSAYQVEGAAAEDGRSPSIWDTYTHAGKMPDKSTGDVASDGYHKYKEDVKLMSNMGLEAYRFSISWSRLIPNGRGVVNPKGLKYYNNLIDELVKHGIEPHVTLYHLDLPQILQDEYGGWLSSKIVDDFTAYAGVCFREFGDRVSHWTTVIEPNVIGQACYDIGIWPPNRCSYPFGSCTEGNSSVEPYIAVHNILLAHSSIAMLYRTEYRAKQKGQVGINFYGLCYIPLTNSTADAEATKRVMDYSFGWILDPLVFGDYPKIMKKNAGSRLPSFTKNESEQVKGSFDFIGMNYYTLAYVQDKSDGPKSDLRDYSADMFAVIKASNNENSTGQFVPSHIEFYPRGLQDLLEYLKQVYGNPPIYIQENGYGLGANDTLNDTDRRDFLNGYIGSTLDAIKNGSDVRGFSVWSFMDVFEFLSGYSAPMGLIHVDFEDEKRPRQPKLSAHWYASFLNNSKKGVAIKKPGFFGGPLAQQ